MHHGLRPEQMAELAALRLPLPSARSPVDPTDPITPLVHSILAEDGLTRDMLKLKGQRLFFFSKGDRAALCLPEDVQHATGPDERHPGRHKLVLRFVLPRGCYATLIIKRLTAPDLSPSPRTSKEEQGAAHDQTETAI
jgi:tRNA pseudouridine13 synthase